MLAFYIVMIDDIFLLSYCDTAMTQNCDWIFPKIYMGGFQKILIFAKIICIN